MLSPGWVEFLLVLTAPYLSVSTREPESSLKEDAFKELLKEMAKLLLAVLCEAECVFHTVALWADPLEPTDTRGCLCTFPGEKPEPQSWCQGQLGVTLPRLIASKQSWSVGVEE